MKPFNIAILSDLHIGRKARAKDLCPYIEDGPKVDNKYKDNFLGFIRNKKIIADYLVISGDITDTAGFEEFRLASELVKEIAQELNICPQKIVFVPGNHDVDWKVLGLGNNPLRQEQKYGAIQFKDLIFKDLIKAGNGSVIEDPFFNLQTYDNLNILSYNSSWHDNPETAIHYGIIDQTHLDKLAILLKDLEISPNKVGIFLVHHHPKAYDSPVPGTIDFSQMVNSERLFSLLTCSYFDLIIHGHIHQPRFKTHDQDASIPIGILSAGSFSFDLPKEWQGKINNQFHLLRIDGRDSKTKCIMGKIESWTYYCAHGWIESQDDRDGIEHIEPFGVYVKPFELKTHLKSVVKGLLTSQGHIEWSDLIKADPTIEYMRPIRIIKALEELQDLLDFRIHGKTIDKIILLQGKR